MVLFYFKKEWDCVDISPEAIEENRAYVFINKESQRTRKESGYTDACTAGK